MTTVEPNPQGLVWCDICKTWVAPLESKCPKCGKGDDNLQSVSQHLKDLESKPFDPNQHKAWCDKCEAWINPVDGKCPKCGRPDNLLYRMRARPEISTSSAPSHGYASEQPTHDMIKAGVMAWDTWHSVIEVWRQMETVRRWQANKRQV